MKILDAGHRYTLDSLDGELVQTIQFVKREGENFPFNYGTAIGTNCQEVLRVLIDRTEYLYNQNPCAETEAIIGNLRSALLLFEVRASRRHKKLLSLHSTQEIMNGVTCSKCKHIGCDGTCH